MDRRTRIKLVLAVMGLLMASLACSNFVLGGRDEVREDSTAVERQGADTVDIFLEMAAGEIAVQGGASQLAEMEFVYSNEDWKPLVDYSVSGGEGELRIEQPRKMDIGSYRYEWDVKLNNEIPMTLDVKLGAGENNLDLSQLDISRLDLEVGAGNLELDLRGDRSRDLDVRVRGGVGEVTVILPREIGVRAEIQGGIGEVSSDGLNQENGAYINEAYGQTETSIHLDIEGGIGEIMLQVEE